MTITVYTYTRMMYHMLYCSFVTVVLNRNIVLHLLYIASCFMIIIIMLIDNNTSGYLDALAIL